MKKKIVLIIFLPKFVISGAGNSVFQMINGLDKKKFIIYVICFSTFFISPRIGENTFSIKSTFV